jgi:hypothetical protein
MKSSGKQMTGIALASAAILLFLSPGIKAQKPGTARHQGKICEVTTFSMNKICKEWDGQWEGITVASDGNCYFGTSTHSRGHGAGFHMYDPETKEHTMLAEDMTLVCGEGDTETQQGKIHSPIVECDGWLYFATHLSNYWPEGIELYIGAHVIGYELVTGKFRDFGVIKPRYSIYSAINVDPERKILYVFVAPFHEHLIRDGGCFLYSIDIASGEKEELGQITKGQTGACFWFYVDNEGNCWFNLWKLHQNYEHDPGNLYCYRFDDRKMVTYEDVLPKGELIDGTPVTDEKLLGSRAWTWAQALPGREKCLFTMGNWGGGDERLWIFDPSKNILKGKAFQPVAYIGSTFLETALGGDRLYFVQYESLEDQRTQSAEANRENDPDEVGYEENLHLRSISIVPDSDDTIIDHGKIVDQDGRAARMINSLAADDRGRVYMMGSWYIKSFKEASLQILFYDHPGERIYELVKRGEFFAVAETGKK